MGADDILAGLDEQQQAAARSVDGPVLILAGPGSGKTRTITHRIAYATAVGAQRPDRGLAVTFTAKAAGQMRSRLAALGVSQVAVMTFHAAALRQLRHFWPQAVGGPAPKLLPAKAPVLAEAAASVGAGRDRLLLRDLAAEIEWAKVSRLRRDDYAQAAQQAGRSAPGGLTHATVAAVYGTYGDLLAQRGLIDFEDVLVLTNALLTERPDLGDQVRQRYRWITVDEYQDLSAIQHALLQTWLGESDQLCVVGDPSQTIYTFAGASASYLHGFRRWFPHAATVPLARSYRCTPQIVAAANRLMSAGQAGVLRLTSQEPPGPAPRVVACDDDLHEAAMIAARVAQWRDEGVPLRQIAVLVRIAAATAPIEDALTAAGIAYTVTGGERFFSRAEIREAVVRLRGAAKGGVGSGRLTEDVAEVLSAMGFLAADAPAGRGQLRERWESLAALTALAADLAAGKPTAELSDLVAELDRRAGLEAEPVLDGVVLATLHAAKGLEWDAVWIAGMQEGMLPISYAETLEQIEEERRLCYVGITRARRTLVLSWSAARVGGSRTTARMPSRFLRDLASSVEVQGDLPQSRRGLPRPTRRSERGRPELGRCRVCGRGLATPTERALHHCRTCPSEVDLALLERLRAWRLEQVAATGAPAFTVFTDLTLQAIATMRPASAAELLEISGIGPGKAERYGAALLDLVAQQPAAG